ncbi:MAG: hypothetical protein EBU96_10925, partial [Actinobacteria bacterium]|nr:hypothetical protein [Actinomycetota bacterium]
NDAGFINLSSLSAGAGISYNNLTGVITNSSPDQIVVLTNGTGISISGTYPSFTITNTSPSSGGTVTAVTASSPLASSGGTTPNITIQQASGSSDGYLSSTDWTTFNSKEPAIAAGTTSQYWRGDKTWQTFPTIPTVTPSALTKTDDTNVTLTLGGTPNTALLESVSLTLGWTGTLADSRIASAATWNSKEPGITPGTTSQYWRGDKTWQTLDKSAVGLSNVENTALSTWAGSTNLTTLGTIVTGVWNGTAIGDTYISSASTWNAKQNAYTNLTTIGTLANAAGYLYNDGSGVFSYTTPTGGVTSVGATAPITSSGGTTPTISTSMSTNKLIGRSTAGTGVMEEISVGTGLSLSAGTLSASGVIPHGTASGTDTYTATIGTASSYSDGDAYLVRFTNGNTTSCTLNINSIGAKTLYRNNDGALIGGDIVAGAEMLCIYNSTLDGFQTIGTAPNTLLGYVTNAESISITKGQPVYAFSGTGDRMSVKLAYNTSDATSAQTVGLVLSSSIAAGQKGLIMIQGLLDGLSILPTS